MKQIALIILSLLWYSTSDAQRTISPNDPVYFQKSYILPKEKFYLLSVKRATAHYYQFYNAVAKEKRAKEITLIEIYPDSLIKDTNQLISHVTIERYNKGFLTEELSVKYVKGGGKLPVTYDTIAWKQYQYKRRNHTVSVLNKRYGEADNYTDSLRTFYFNCRKRLVRTITRNDEQRQTDTRFGYKRSGDLKNVTSVYLNNQTQIPLTEKRWRLSYKNQTPAMTIPDKLLDSAGKIAALDFIRLQLSGPPDKAKKILVTSFERLPQEQEFRLTGTDSMIINYKGAYNFVVNTNDDTTVQVKKIEGKQAVHRVYLELSANDNRKRAFKYTTREIIDGQIFYENNFRGKIISGSCSLDIEKTVISDTEDGTVEFYRIKR